MTQAVLTVYAEQNIMITYINYKKPNIIQTIKICMHKWLGQVKRMEDLTHVTN